MSRDITSAGQGWEREGTPWGAGVYSWDMVSTGDLGMSWLKMILGMLSGRRVSHTVRPGRLRLGQDQAGSA